MRVPRPLEANGKGIRGARGVAGKEACTVHTTNIISQWQCTVARRVSSYVGKCLWFAQFVQGSDVGEKNGLVQATVRSYLETISTSETS
jgi:hypothetical protein